MQLYDRTLSRTEATALLEILARHSDSSPGDRLVRLFGAADCNGDVTPQREGERIGLLSVLRGAVMARQHEAIARLLSGDRVGGEELSRSAALAWRLLNHVIFGANRLKSRCR